MLKELPEYWCIKRTPKTADVINGWFADNCEKSPFFKDGYIWLDDGTFESHHRKPSTHTKITFDDFVRLVLPPENGLSEKKQTKCPYCGTICTVEVDGETHKYKPLK